MVKVIYGEETYLLDQIVAKETSGIELPEMNLARFYDECDYVAVEQFCSAAPFLADRRVVVLSLSEFKTTDELKSLVSKVKDSDNLLLIVAKKADKRSALLKGLDVTECGKPDQIKVTGLMKRVAASEGVEIADDAIAELLKRISYYEEPQSDLYAVIGAIRQLAHTGDITLSSVKSMLPESVAGNAFQLLSLICNKSAKEAYELMEHLLDCGENAIGILSLVARGFRLAWKDKAGVESGKRFQYECAMRFSTAKLVEAQEIVENAVECLKNGVSEQIGTRIALTKLLNL